MGLLDDLKKQADMVKSQQISAQSNLQEGMKLVESKMHQTFLYLNELLKQLAVIKPVNPMAYSIPGIADFQNLSFAESFCDYRKKKIGDKDYYDNITMFIKWASPSSVTVERDMPATMQKVRDALWGFNLKFSEEEVKKPGGNFQKMKFIIPSAVTLDLILIADHENARIVAKGRNVFRLGADEMRIPAGEINDALLEELAKTLIGQPSAMRKFRVGAF
jgi:hypothetical protein